MRQPNRPHRDGFEDEEDCVGHFDPDETVMEERGCSSCRTFDHRVSESSEMTGRQCYEAGRAKEAAEWQAWWDAKTPDEKAAHEAFVKGLREAQ